MCKFIDRSKKGRNYEKIEESVFFLYSIIIIQCYTIIMQYSIDEQLIL